MAQLDGISFPTLVIPARNKPDHYIVNSQKLVVLIKWKQGKRVKIIEQLFRVENDPEKAANSLHMGMAHCNGKYILAGTFRGVLCSNLPNPYAGFYIYSRKTGVVHYPIPDMKTVGGVAMNAAGTQVFIVDICRHIVRCFDFNPDTGEMCK